MFSSIFSIIELILKLIGLWNGFLNYVDKKRIADAEKNRQEREKAVDQLKGAKSEEDFDRAQSDVVIRKP